MTLIQDTFKWLATDLSQIEQYTHLMHEDPRLLSPFERKQTWVRTFAIASKIFGLSFIAGAFVSPLVGHYELFRYDQVFFRLTAAAAVAILGREAIYFGKLASIDLERDLIGINESMEEYEKNNKRNELEAEEQAKEANSLMVCLFKALGI